LHHSVFSLPVSAPRQVGAGRGEKATDVCKDGLVRWMPILKAGRVKPE
jgi:hypothetical protein